VALRGDTICSASYDGCLGLWKRVGGQPTLETLFYLHDKGVNCVAASPAGAELATGGSDGIACIVIPESGQASRCSHPGDVECLAFSEDGRLLFSGGTDGFGRVFDVKTGRIRLAIKHGKTVGAACRHPNPALLVTGCNDRKLRLIKWEDGEVIAVSDAHTGPVKALAVCRIGILSTGHDQRLLLHDFDLGNPRELARFSTTPKSIATEPDSNSVWIGVYDQRLLRYGCYGNELRLELSFRSSRFWAHGLAAGSNCAVIGSFDGSPLVCAATGGHHDILPPVSSTAVPCISTALAEKGGSVLVAGDSGEIYSVRSESQERSIVASMGEAITSMVGDRHDLVVGTWDGVVARLSGAREIWRARWPDSLGGEQRAPSPVLRVSRDAERVLAGTYTHGWVCFQEADGQPLWHSTEATGAVKCVDIRDDVFAVTGRYDPLRIGDAITGTIRARLNLATPVSDVVSISPFASASRARIAVSAAANEIWMVDLYGDQNDWELRVVHRSSGNRLPVKALLWISEDTVLAGDYAGSIVEHRLNYPSTLLMKAPCRLGISSLSLDGRGKISYATFDGEIGLMERLEQLAA
jgi:WD40 repeat protein